MVKQVEEELQCTELFRRFTSSGEPWLACGLILWVGKVWYWVTEKMPRRSLTNANPLGLEHRRADRSWSTIFICTLKLWTLVTTYWLQCFKSPCCAAISCSHLPVLSCLSHKLFDLFLYFCHKSCSELDWTCAAILPSRVRMTRPTSDKLTWFGPCATLQEFGLKKFVGS